MSNSTSSLSGSAFIKPNVAPLAVDSVFTKTPLINTFLRYGRIVPSGGSSTVQWNVRYSRDIAASAWTENQSITAFGGTLTVGASQASQFGKVPFGVTDYQLANQANGGVYQNVSEFEREKATADLLKYFEGIFVSNGASTGISSLVDSTGTAHGIDSGTYTTFASVENSVSGSSFLSGLDDTWSDLLATNADPSSIVLFMSPEVTTIYQGVVASNMRAMYGQPLDLGKNPGGSSLSFNGREIVTIPGASASECYFVDMSKAKIVMHIAPEIVVVPATNMGENLCARAAMCLILEDRGAHGKVTQINLRSS